MEGIRGAAEHLLYFPLRQLTFKIGLDQSLALKVQTLLTSSINKYT